MALIDRTYVSISQWKLAKKFHTKTLAQQKKQLGKPIQIIYKKPFDGCALWSTSLIEDIWLKKYCDLDFVQARLDEQYGDDGETSLSEFANRVDFSTNKVLLVSVTHPKTNAHWDLFTEDLKVVSTETFRVFDKTDTILVYGTTDFYTMLYNIQTEDSEYNFVFEYFGCPIEYSDGNFYFFEDESDKVVDFDFFPLEFELPKFKLSFNSKDINKFPKEKVFFCCDEKNFSSLEQYENIDGIDLSKGIKCGRFQTPQPLTSFIK